MYGDDLAFLRFEVQGLGKKIGGHIMSMATEFDKNIQTSLERLTDDGSLQRIVDEQVQKGLTEAFKSAFDSYEIQSKLKNIILDSLNTKGSGKRKGKEDGR